MSESESDDDTEETERDWSEMAVSLGRGGQTCVLVKCTFCLHTPPEK